jgi:probable F420-dependent oxidoreductase
MEQDLEQQAARLRERLGRVGVWFTALGFEPAAVEREAAAEIEALGYGALWIGEGLANKEAFAHSGLLLSATRQLVVATGIASIWARDATAMTSGGLALAEAHPGRFLLGLGVSHGPVVTTRGHDYGRPLTAMRTYLDEMDRAPYRGPVPADGGPRVLAALRPKMIALSGERTAGAHTYFVPPEHTARAREILGPEPFLAPEQAVVLETDPARARAVAREHMRMYLTLPNYLNSLRELGFTDADFADGGSDALTDAIVAWGDADAIRERVRAHLDAGADHVAIQPVIPGVPAARDHLRALAPAVVGA